MKVTFELYKPGEEFLTLPYYFITNLPDEYHFNAMDLYYKTVQKLLKDPPRPFLGKSIALKPISIRYSTRTQGGVEMRHVELTGPDDLSRHPPPQQIEGEFHATYTVNYRIGCSCHKVT